MGQRNKIVKKKELETCSLIKRYDLNNKVKLLMNYLRDKNSTSK